MYDIFLKNILPVLDVIVLAIAAFLAWRIGVIQNRINKRSLQIRDFVELFVMPQQISIQEEGIQLHFQWSLLIKNVSSYPIYIKRFSLNGIAHMIGNSAIPPDTNNWYRIPIPTNVTEELSLDIEFEDYMGKNYISRHYGVFENASWQIRSEKRKEIVNKL